MMKNIIEPHDNVEISIKYSVRYPVLCMTKHDKRVDK